MPSDRIELNIISDNQEILETNLKKFEKDIKKTMKVDCRENLNEYLLNSTLHGLRYVGDRKISRVERAFFAVIFLVVMILSIYFISEVWIKWSYTPVIITLSSRTRSITDLPFPAVTVCDMNQVKQSAIQKFSRDSFEYYVTKSICRQDLGLQDDTFSQKPTWQIFQKLLSQVSPSCEETLLYCEYGGKPFKCTTKISTIITDDGLCCIFNGVSRKTLLKTEFEPVDQFGKGNETVKGMSNMWTPEMGYPNDRSEDHSDRYPIPGVGPGNELGLTLIMKSDIQDYFCSSTRSSGFKILLNSPNDLAKVAHYGVAIPIGYETRIGIKPTISGASDAVRKIPINVRQCIFDNENFLSYYSTYSDRNCLSECETKCLYENCQCVMYYQPHEHGNISICGIADRNCMNIVYQEMISERNESFKCDHCLTGCFAINYDSTYSTGKIFEKIPFLRRNNLTTKNIAIVHIYYGQSTFRSQHKEELVGFTDFLSSMGGLLGLFMGFSFISVIELVYFISIRPYFNYLRFSGKRRELMTKLVRKIDKLRHKKESSMIITVASCSSFERDNLHSYID